MNDAQPEVESKLDNFARRLTELGATQDELMAVLNHWTEDTPDWGPDDRDRLLRASDPALRAMIRQVRAEWAEVNDAAR